MKRVIAIFLLLQIVSNNAFAEELIKMPKLFTHYFHHAREHKDTDNFLSYLREHYSGQHEKDSHLKSHNHEDEDCKLPFKHCGNCCTSLHSPVTGFVSSYLSAECVSFPIGSSHFIRKDDRIESQDLCSIWQPPKIA